jgi:CheY-like chemotaxis protein
MRAGRHVVVIDDDADFRALMEELLRQEGYCCTSVPSLVAALGHVARGGVNLVLTDGFTHAPREIIRETVAIVRAAAPAPVVLCTAHRVDEAAARAAGFAAVLTKPFNLDDLVALVEALAKSGP